LPIYTLRLILRSPPKAGVSKDGPRIQIKAVPESG